jgi:hypothetical protein
MLYEAVKILSHHQEAHKISVLMTGNFMEVDIQ